MKRRTHRCFWIATFFFVAVGAGLAFLHLSPGTDTVSNTSSDSGENRDSIAPLVQMLKLLMDDPRSLEEFDDSLELSAQLLHPQYGAAADYRKWCNYRSSYERQLERNYAYSRLRTTRFCADRPLDGPIMLEQRAMQLFDARDIVGLMRQALDLADVDPPDLNGQTSEAQSPIERMDRDLQRAHNLLADQMLAKVTDLKPELRFLSTWLCRTGKTYVRRSDRAPVYELATFLNVSDPYMPGDRLTSTGLSIPTSLATMPSAYHLFRALGGEPVISKGWTPADMQAAGQHRQFADRRIDLTAGAQALMSIAPILDQRFLQRLRSAAIGMEPIPTDGVPEGVTGQVLFYRRTNYGGLLVAGPGPNRYNDCKAAVIIDLGGDDHYLDKDRLQRIIEFPLSIVIDMDGDDVYVADGVVGAGAGVFGLGVLMDLNGNDRYLQGVNEEKIDQRVTLVGDRQSQQQWVDPMNVYGEAAAKPLDTGFAYGAAMFGIGLLVDRGGDDLYVADKWAFGASLGHGVGVMLDESGNDRYIAATLSIGAGVNKGVGILIDKGGEDDLYQCWGVYRWSLRPHHGDAGFLSFGMGAGSGWRAELRPDGYRGMPTSASGVGLLLDGGGDDLYIGANCAQGCGSAGGVGALVDRGGNDRYLSMAGDLTGRAKPTDIAGAHMMGDAGHRGTGLLLDYLGDDFYMGSLECGGYGWDAGVGFLIDLNGDDRYEPGARGRFEAGSSGAQGMGVLINVGGRDVFARGCDSLGSAANFKPTYQPPGGNFSIVLLMGEQQKRLPDPLGNIGPGKVILGATTAGMEPDGQSYPHGIGFILCTDKEHLASSQHSEDRPSQ